MSRVPPSILKRASMGLVVATFILAGVEGALRSLWGPAPNPVKVYGALGERDQYFELSSGMARRLYGENPLPPFEVHSPSPRVAMRRSSVVQNGGTPGRRESLAK